MKTRSNVYRERLTAAVLENSVIKSWNNAVTEWSIVDREEDEALQSSCICGKEGIRYRYTIKNDYNGKILFPIGSSCIKAFGRTDLNEELKITEKMFKLLSALKNHKFIILSSELFSRKLLTYLYENNAFDTEYNKFDGYSDYRFMVKMFNKREENVTYNQKKKISAIILNSIFPYLKSMLKVRSASK